MDRSQGGAAGAKANRSGGGRGCLLCDSHHKYACVHPILIVQSVCTCNNVYYANVCML